MGTLFLVSLIFFFFFTNCMILRPLGRSFLSLAMLGYCEGNGLIEGITCNGGLGTSQKTVYQHKFVVLYIVSCRVAIKS